MSDDEDDESADKTKGAPVVAGPVRWPPEMVERLNKALHSPAVVELSRKAESIHLQFSPEALRGIEQFAASVLDGLQTWSTALARTIAVSVQQLQPLFRPEVLEGWQHWVRNMRTFAESLQRTQEALARAEEMGKAGWTLPLNASWPEYLRLLRECNDPASADRAFTDYYAANDRENEKELFDVLLASPKLDHFKPLLEEVRFCLMYGRCRVAVPALFTLLEGALRTAWHGDAWSSSGQDTFIEAQLERLEPDAFERLHWTATRVFLRKLYAPDGPTKPPALNRHWIMHGREPGDADRVDCLRLLQAVHTVLTIAEADEVPGTLALEPATVTAANNARTSQEVGVHSDVSLMVTRLAALRIHRRASVDNAELQNALTLAEAALTLFLLERFLRTQVPDAPEKAPVQGLLEQVAKDKGPLPVPYPVRKRGLDAFFAIRAFLGRGAELGAAGALDVGAHLVVEVDAVFRLVAQLLAQQNPALAEALLRAGK